MAWVLVQDTHEVGVVAEAVVVVEVIEQTALVELALAKQRTSPIWRYGQFSPLLRDGFRA
jgi:hypothetical protein